MSGTYDLGVKLSREHARPAANPVTAALAQGGLVGQSARSLVASAAALGGDLIVYAILVQAQLAPAAAGAVGYSFGLVLHYSLSAGWVFPDRARRRRAAPTFVKFAATGLLGLALTAAIIGALTGAGLCGAYIAKAIAVALSYLSVFTLRRLYVFAE